MKYYFILIALFFLNQKLRSQIPEAYQLEMNRQVGTWVADNEAYMNANETDDSYAIQWQWGAGKQSLLGLLSGMKDGLRTNDYWQFIQFWDIGEEKLRVIQISAYSIYMGEGFFEVIDSTHTQLIQKFTTPNGTSSWDGHKTEIHPKYEISTSYTIEGDLWKEKRLYTWNKIKKSDTD
ncbi:MAG: hypothetical protein MUO53_13725 [Maribacter sp.]|nr:hypothetical protein [Maribacter sp.]